jgi:hypothetical protein
MMSPHGKTIDECEQDDPEEPEEDEEEEVSEEEVKPAKKARGGNANSKKNDKNAGRPKRATASRVWTNGNLPSPHESKKSLTLFAILDFGSSEEEEEIEEARPRVGRKKRGEDSDEGSDVSAVESFAQKSI